MSRKIENTGFPCAYCGAVILPVSNGSYRNHCPLCLYSKHVDEKPGDRSNTCLGLMRPIDIVYHTKKGYQIVHECLSCGVQKRNKVAQHTLQEDQLLPFFKAR